MANCAVAMPSSKKEAIERGLNRYFTGKPCKRNHLALRSVSNNRCIECGKILRKRSYIIEKEKDINFCKNLYKRRISKSSDPYSAWINSTLNNNKTRAKRKNVQYNLNSEYLRSIIKTHCPIFGFELDYSMGNKGHVKQNSPSIDRIVPELGYIEGNIIVVSYRANSIRQDATIEELTKVRDFYERIISG